MLRHGRQVQLDGIGEGGQAKLARAKVAVFLDGLAGEVAARYLAGAGVGHLSMSSESMARAARSVDASVEVDVEVSSVGPREEVPAFDLRDPAARSIARGAHFALAALRAVLASDAKAILRSERA